MSITHTHTYARLALSEQSYREIADKLTEAGYTCDLEDDEGRPMFDMHGIAVCLEPNPLAGSSGPSNKSNPEGECDEEDED